MESTWISPSTLQQLYPCFLQLVVICLIPPSFFTYLSMSTFGIEIHVKATWLAQPVPVQALIPVPSSRRIMGRSKPPDGMSNRRSLPWNRSVGSSELTWDRWDLFAFFSGKNWLCPDMAGIALLPRHVIAQQNQNEFSLLAFHLEKRFHSATWVKTNIAVPWSDDTIYTHLLAFLSHCPCVLECFE